MLSKRVAAIEIVLLSSLLGPSSVLGDELLTPPRPTTPLKAAYPPDAHGDETVVLEVEIDAQGHVVDAHVLTGREPFASQCEAQAAAWTFSPALRGEAPVRARIHVEVRFTEPRPTLNAMSSTIAPQETHSATVSKREAPALVPLDVHVQGIRAEPSETRLSISEAREVPGGLGDPVRALSALPGVAPLGRGSPYVYVRGAPPGNNGYLVDGVRVPLLFHAGLASSILQPAVIETLDFFSSAVPARYGGFAGAIVEIETRPPSERFRSEAAVKLYEGSALVEAPFLETRGSALAAFRYGYPRIVLALVDPSTHIAYWDYQSRATWVLGEHDRIGVFAFGSHDRTSHDERQFQGATTEVEDLGSDFHRADVRYDHDFTPTERLRVAASLGWSSVGAKPTYVDAWTYAGRFEGEAAPDEALRVRAGVQLQSDAYTTASGAPTDPSSAPPGANPPPTNLTTGAYADAIWTPTPALELVPGVRFDLFKSTRADPSASGTVPAVEPRIALRVKLASGVAWLSSVGLAHQYPVLRVGTAPANAVNVPGFSAGDVHLQTSGQASDGLEIHLPWELVARAAVFGSITRRMTDLPDTCNQRFDGTREMPGPAIYLCADKPVRGLAYGMELSLRRALTRGLTGWLSYTLSRATERYSATSGSISSPFDRTHVFSAIAAYEIGAGFRASARVVAYSGVPYLRFSGDQRVPVGGYRFPAFFRIDGRLEKQWTLGPDQSIRAVLEMQNATLSREIDSLDCDTPSTPLSACRTNSGPTIFIPSIGVEGSF